MKTKQGRSTQRNHYKHLKMHVNIHNCLDLGFVSDILSFLSVLCGNNQDPSCKVTSQYFSKMVLMLRNWCYPPIPIKLQNSYIYRV